MNTLRKSRRTMTNALALAAGLLAGVILTPAMLHAQAATPTADAQQKLDLMNQAIDAETHGDYVKARDTLSQIVAMDPKSSSSSDLQVHIAELDKAIASQAQGKPTRYDATGPVASATPVAVTQLSSGVTMGAVAPSAATPTASTDTAAPAKPAPAAPPRAEAVAQMKIEAEKQHAQVKAAGDAIESARSLAAAGQYDDARAKLAAAEQALPPGLAFAGIDAEIKQDSANTWFDQANAAYKANKFKDADDALANYVKLEGDNSSAQKMRKAIADARMNPMRQDPEVADPNYLEKQDRLKQMLVTARAQYLYGDYTEALQSFDRVITYSPDNMEAQAYVSRINQMLFDNSYIARTATRTQMLQVVNEQWRLPSVYNGENGVDTNKVVTPPEQIKLDKIIIPRVDIDIPTPLDQVIATLKVLSQKYDPDGKGLNFMVLPPPNGAPMPKIKLQEMTEISLGRLVEAACREANYGYYIDKGVVSLSQGSNVNMSSGEFDRKTIPMSLATYNRLVNAGKGAAGGGTADTGLAPAASGGASTPTDTSTTAAAPAVGVDDQALMDFFVKTGIDFPSGTRLAYADGFLYVTNTPRNLDALTAFLRRYNTVKQVEIETRFLDVTQGTLDEFSATWNVNNPTQGQANNFLTTGTNLRGLGTAFQLGNSGAAPTVITGLTNAAGGSSPNLTIPQTIPSLPNSINVANNSTNIFGGVISWLQGYRINLMLDALSQKQGADLMSAPKVVAMNGVDARILVAQKLRYPDTFSPIQSAVQQGTTNVLGGGGGGGGVTITAGTPNGFTPQNIGVEMSVTPQIYDDQTIELVLHPTVTEFEGFIEYGGTSIAIQSGTTASVPSGFIQPIFVVREVETNVTIFDGATVVLGGLTRDEVKTVDDKIPVLGDIPLLGRLFQSKGETSQKRNLMIFVTANIISPGGSPTNQSIAGVSPGAIFSNPTLITPNRAVPRTPEVPISGPIPTSP